MSKLTKRKTREALTAFRAGTEAARRGERIVNEAIAFASSQASEQSEEQKQLVERVRKFQERIAAMKPQMQKAAETMAGCKRLSLPSTPELRKAFTEFQETQQCYLLTLQRWQRIADSYQAKKDN